MKYPRRFTESLSQEVNGDAIAVDKFSEIDSIEENLNPYDYYGYDVTVSDEICFNVRYKLSRTQDFIEKKPIRIIIDADDVSQLEPVTDVTNQRPRSIYERLYR